MINIEYRMSSLDLAVLPANGPNQMYGSLFPGASGEGLEHALAYLQYFGYPAKGIESLRPVAYGDERARNRFQFTDAYMGRSDVLRETVLGLATVDADWVYSEPDGLPLTMANNLTLTWFVERFEESPMPIVPEEGTSRVSSQSKEQYAETMRRRGAAAEFEHGFFKTEQGRRNYAQKIQQMANNLSVSLCALGLVALVNPKMVRKPTVNAVLNQVLSTKRFSELCDYQASNFAAWQKSSYAAKKTVSDAKSLLEFRKKGPSMMVIPRGLETFLKGAENSAQLDAYVVGGQVAEQRRSVNPESITRFEQLRVRHTRKFNNGENGQFPSDPFVNPARMFGEFYQFPALKPDHPVYNEKRAYKTSDRDIQIPNYKIDKFQKLTLKDVVANLSFETPDDGNAPLTGHGTGKENAVVENTKVVKSPFHYVGAYGAIKRCQVFGQMHEAFLSDKAIEVMAQQIAILPKAQRDLFASYSAYNGSSLRGLLTIVQTDMPSGPSQLTSVVDAKTRGLTYASAMKRTRAERDLSGEDSGLSLGFFTSSLKELKLTPGQLQPSSTADIDSLHLKNQSLLRGDTLSHYSFALKDIKDSALKESFIRRTDSILSSASQEAVQSELYAPLQALAELPKQSLTKDEKIAQQDLLKTQLCSFVPIKTGASLISVPNQNSPELYTSSQIQQRSDNGEVFTYLNIDDGVTVTSPYSVKIDSLDSFERLLKAVSFTNTTSSTTYGLSLDNVKADPDLHFDKEAIHGRIERLIGRSTFDSTIAIVLLTQLLNRKFFNFLVDNNIYFPFVPVVCRPFVVVVTATVVIGSGGSDLGGMYMKDPDVMFEDDATSKMHKLHFTGYWAPVIYNPDLLYVVDDVVVVDYFRGGTCDPISKAAIDAIQARNFQVPLTDIGCGSIFYVLTPVIKDGAEQLPHKVHLNGNVRSDEEEEDDVPEWYFHQDDHHVRAIQNVAEDPHPLFPYSAETGRPHIFNRLMFQGTQLCYNPLDEKFNAVIKCPYNHLGAYYNGAIHDLRTQDLVLRDVGYNDASKYIDYFTI